MKISDYASSLTSTLTRDNILEDLDSNGKKLQALVAMAEKLVAIEKMVKKVPKPVGFMTTAILRNSSIKTKPRIGATIKALTPEVVALNDELEERIGKDFPPTLITANADVKQLSTIAYVEFVSFYIDYSSKLLIEVGKAYAQSQAKGSVEAYETSRMMAKMLTDGQVNYTKVLGLVGGGVSAMKDTLSSVPVVVVRPGSEEVVSRSAKNYGKAPILTMRLGFRGNPIYGLRKWLSNIVVSRYRTMQARKDQLELLLLAVKAEQEDNPSPAVQAEIESIEDRIANLEYKMLKAED